MTLSNILTTLTEAFDATNIINQIKEKSNWDEKQYTTAATNLSKFAEKIRQFNPAVMRPAVLLAITRSTDPVGARQIDYTDFLYNLWNPDAFILYYKTKNNLEKIVDNDKKEKAEELFKQFENGSINPHDFEKESQTLFEKEKGRKVKENEYKMAYKENGWEIVIPKTYNASVYFARTKEGKTRWCTAADSKEGKEAFEDYSGRGELKIIRNYEQGIAFQFLWEDDDQSPDGIMFMNKEDVAVRRRESKQLKSLPRPLLSKILPKDIIEHIYSDNKVIKNPVSNNKRLKGVRPNIIESKTYKNIDALQTIFEKYYPKNVAQAIADKHDAGFYGPQSHTNGTVYVFKMNGETMESLAGFVDSGEYEDFNYIFSVKRTMPDDASYENGDWNDTFVPLIKKNGKFAGLRKIKKMNDDGLTNDMARPIGREGNIPKSNIATITKHKNMDGPKLNFISYNISLKIPSNDLRIIQEIRKNTGVSINDTRVLDKFNIRLAMYSKDIPHIAWEARGLQYPDNNLPINKFRAKFPILWKWMMKDYGISMLFRNLKLRASVEVV